MNHSESKKEELKEWCSTTIQFFSGLMNEKVQIYIDPSDGEKAWVKDPLTRRRILIRRLNRVENASVARRQHIRYPHDSIQDKRKQG